MNSGGLEREFFIYIPDNLIDSTDISPLVMNFHGGEGYAEYEMEYTGFRELSESENFIAVYPQGTVAEGKGSTGWFTGIGCNTAGEVCDVAFISELIDALVSEYYIDGDRVYASGFSNGGFMIYSLACYLSDKVAAFGPVAGLMYTEELDNCTPDRALPIIHIHGENDSSIPIGGSSYAVGFSSVLEYWTDFNQCTATAIVDGADNNGDGYAWSATIKDECNDGVRLAFYRLGGTDHEWPNRDGLGYDNDIDAASTIWNFMQDFDLNGERN
jgi:polyhydroxybutyrate depolymerase|tara:strand:- start:2914 stop:3726 length:813 start_codon:yes stop_codon:yes gene_type:complete